MIKAASFAEAHRNRYLLPEYPAVYLETHITNLIADFRDARDPAHLDGGQALFAEYGPGIALTHAHPVDQWQVYLDGNARLARKAVQPVVVQYTDAWVPYGPIEVAPEGFCLLALWPKPNAETYEMPKDVARIRANLRGQPRRNLHQRIDLDDAAPASMTISELIAEPDVWARRWRLPAGAVFATPSGAGGGGQFFIPLSGVIEYGEQTYARWSTLYVGPADRPIILRAGVGGADVIGMQFRVQS